MRDYNGVILVRNGRVIGVDSKAPTDLETTITTLVLSWSFQV